MHVIVPLPPAPPEFIFMFSEISVVYIIEIIMHIHGLKTWGSTAHWFLSPLYFLFIIATVNNCHC